MKSSSLPKSNDLTNMNFFHSWMSYTIGSDPTNKRNNYTHQSTYHQVRPVTARSEI